MNNRIGEIIEQYRKAKKLTQSQLAKQLGVSNTAISKWENGTNLPDITLIEPLCEILEIDKLLLFTSENKDKEEVSKRHKTIRRKNIIKNSISLTIFLLILLFTNYISYSVYKHKLETIKSSQPEIYRFYSKDDEYFVNGYIIFKENESTVIFDQLSYQERKRTPDNDKITSAELFFYIDDEMVLKKNYDLNNKEKININTSLSMIKETLNKSKMSFSKDDIKDLSLKIVINRSKKITKKTIKLQICKEI